MSITPPKISLRDSVDNMTMQNGGDMSEVLVMRPWHLHHGIEHKYRGLTSYNKYNPSTDDNMQIGSKAFKRQRRKKGVHAIKT